MQLSVLNLICFYLMMKATGTRQPPAANRVQNDEEHELLTYREDNYAKSTIGLSR